jgi:hypothetical protein
MRLEHLAGSPVELLEGAETTPCSNGVLHHPPKAFDRVEVVATMGRQEMQAQLAVVVLEGRVELVRSMNSAAIHDHDDLFLGVPEGRHHLMEILAQFLGIKMRHDFIEDFRGPVLDGADDAEQHAAGDAAPRAILQPRLAFETFFTLDLALTQGACAEACTRRFTPPARAGQSKTPQDSFVFIEQNDLAPASAVLQGRQFERAIREVCGVGLEATSGPIVAYFLFFKILRTLSRPSWTPVCCASAVASSRQLHWE